MKKKDGKRLIPINITSGEVKAVNIDLGNKTPEVYIKVALVDEYKNTISHITVGTGCWNDVKNVDLSIKTHILIRDLIKELEICSIKHMNQQRKVLGGKT